MKKAENAAIAISRLFVVAVSNALEESKFADEIIPRYEKPVTRLIPHEEPKMNRKFGAMNGVIKVALCSKAR